MRILPRQRNQFLIFCISMLVIFSISCTKRNSAPRKKVVATVGQQTLTLKEFSNKLSQRLQKYKPFEASQERIIEENKMSIINDFLYGSLISEWSQAQKIFVHPKEISKKINGIKKGYPDEKSFIQSLSESKQSYQEWVKKMHSTLLEKKVLEDINKKLPVPDNKELKKFYDSNIDRFKQREALKVRQMVFYKLLEAKKALDALRKKWSYSRVLKMHKKRKTIKIETAGVWVEKSDNVLFQTAVQLKPREFSSVVESIYGFHIIQLIDRKKGKTLSFNEVKTKIIEEFRTSLQQEKYTQWLRSQLKNTKVMVNSDLIKNIIVKHGKQK